MNETVVGREAEIENFLTPLVAKAMDGAKRVAALVGPPGIGKTTLLRWTRDHAGARGALCAYVRAPAAAGLPPRFPAGEIAEGLAQSCRARGLAVPDALRKLLDTLTGHTSADEYPAALPQIARALEAVAAHAPVALFIDDHHWLPAEGAGLVVGAVRATDARVLLVVTARTPPRHGELALPEPSSDLWIERADLAGIPADAVPRFAAAVLGAELAPSTASALHRRTHGNPLFIAETLRAWKERDALDDIGGVFAKKPGDAGLPASLMDAVRARVEQLDAREAGVLAVVALLGRACAYPELLRASGLDSGGLLACIETLTASGLMSEDAVGGRVTLRIAHPMYEASVTSSLGAARKAALHERIYAALARGERDGHDAASDAGELAHHAVNALHRPAELTERLEAAALGAQRAGDYERATHWFALLRDGSAEGTERWCGATESLAAATANFDPTRATELLTSLLPHLAAEPAARGRALRLRARAYRIRGNFDAALADLRSAETCADPRDALEIRHLSAVVQGIQGRLDGCEAALRALAEDARGTAVHAKAVGHLGQVAFVRGDVAEAEKRWRDALAEAADPSFRLHIQGNLAWLLVLTGGWEEAAELIGDAVETAESNGDAWNSSNLLCTATRLAAWRGRFGDALDLGARAARYANVLGNPAATVAACEVRALALLEMGRAADAEQALAPAVALLRAELEPRELSFTCVVVAEVCVANGEHERAREFLGLAERHLADARTAELPVRRVEALLLMRAGEHDAARDLVEEALDAEPGLLFERARSLELLAMVRAHTNEPHDRVREAAARAERLYEDLGAQARLRRLRDWTSERTPKPLGRPRSALPRGVTAREQEVVRLLARGLTSPEIANELCVAIATVDKHIERAHSKLGTSRRTHLVAEARRCRLV
jgi:DNA-binding CsgD family transcriptional regulator